MRKVILVSIILFSSTLVGCSALKCGCGATEEKSAEKPAEKAPAAASEHKGCGCEGCKKAEGESCSMKK